MTHDCYQGLKSVHAMENQKQKAGLCFVLWSLKGGFVACFTPLVFTFYLIFHLKNLCFFLFFFKLLYQILWEEQLVWNITATIRAVNLHCSHSFKFHYSCQWVATRLAIITIAVIAGMKLLCMQNMLGNLTAVICMHWQQWRKKTTLYLFDNTPAYTHSKKWGWSNQESCKFLSNCFESKFFH